MIKAAISRGGDEEYFTADINSFHSLKKYDLIHSMEVLYYLENPTDVINNIAKSWLNDGGRFIAGIDLYYENKHSHSWQEKVGTPMLMLKESEWIDIFKMSGLQNITSWRANQNKDWPGTLVLTGTK
jgi:2-polyprenyl-3-methyl-5-hydroxy-6-metoxy-1,4-benzoquinol methylase